MGKPVRKDEGGLLGKVAIVENQEELGTILA